MLRVHCIKNEPISSNCFVISTGENKKAVIVDPGSKDNKKIITYLNSKKLFVDKVILTHEHFDHCLGVNALHEIYNFDLYCSEKASGYIQSSKRNFSQYFDAIKPFHILIPCHIVNDFDIEQYDNIQIQFFETPGHSQGSICFLIKDHFFSGDTILFENKTPLHLPGSNKKQYQTSLQKLQKLNLRGKLMHPGHGKSVLLDPTVYSKLFSTIENL